EDVAAALRLPEQVFRPPPDHLDPVLQELLHHLLELEHPRPALDQGQEDNAHRLLERRVLVELVEHQVRVDVFFQVDDDPDRLAPWRGPFVGALVDALDPFVLAQLADLLRQPVPRLLEWDLLDDDLGPLSLYDVGPGPERDPPATLLVTDPDPVPPANDPPGREVWPLHTPDLARAVHPLFHTA